MSGGRAIVPLALVAAFAGCQMMQPAPPAAARSHPSAGRTIDGKSTAAGGNGGVAAAGPHIVLGSASGQPGDVVTLSATLQASGASIAGTQNDLAWDPQHVAVVAKANGKPDCSPNPGIGKEGTAFSFQPPGCGGGSCTGLRALVLSLSSVDPIANGAVLYTCRVRIAAQAPAGVYPLQLSRAGFSTPKGDAITGSGVSGSVTVRAN